MGDGLSFESFAGLKDVCFKTLYNWEKKHPEFAKAKRQGEAKYRLWLERFAKAGLYASPKEFNSTLCIFLLKTRLGYSEKNEEQKTTINILAGKTNDELLQIIQSEPKQLPEAKE